MRRLLLLLLFFHIVQHLPAQYKIRFVVKDLTGKTGQLIAGNLITGTRHRTAYRLNLMARTKTGRINYRLDTMNTNTTEVVGSKLKNDGTAMN